MSVIQRLYYCKLCLSWKQGSRELEDGFTQLRNATDERVRMSQEQLQEAESYRERTLALIELTSQQLLLEESEPLFHIELTFSKFKFSIWSPLF